MSGLRHVETLLHVAGCVVLMFGVTITVFVIAAFTDMRPFGLHPITFGLLFGAGSAATGFALLGAAGALRRYALANDTTALGTATDQNRVRTPRSQ